MTKTFIVYYKISDAIVKYYDGNVIIESDKAPIEKYNCFHFLKYLDKHNEKDYEVTDDDLMLFYDKFVIWVAEIKSSDYNSFNYVSSFNHFYSVENFFAKHSGIHEQEIITFEESQIIDKNFNAGLTYCQKGKYKKCYGYDFTQKYGSVLASDDFKFPTKKGRYVNIKKIADMSKNIQIGYYHVKITCDNPDFNKLFMFSKKHWYTHILIKFCKEHQERFGIVMELIIDDQPNMYSYNRADCISGSVVFSKWHNILAKLKKLHPDNRLVKHLSSSIWGVISHKRIKTMTADEINDADIDYSVDGQFVCINQVMKGNCDIYYEIADKNNLFRFNLRIKSFLTSTARVDIARVALVDLDSVIRINTDGISLLKPIDHTKFQGLREDPKMTGNITFKHVNLWKKEKILILAENETELD